MNSYYLIQDPKTASQGNNWVIKGFSLDTEGLKALSPNSGIRAALSIPLFAEAAYEPLGFWSNYPIQNSQATERCLEIQSKGLRVLVSQQISLVQWFDMVPDQQPQHHLGTS